MEENDNDNYERSPGTNNQIIDFFGPTSNPNQNPSIDQRNILTKAEKPEQESKPIRLLGQIIKTYKSPEESNSENANNDSIEIDEVLLSFKNNNFGYETQKKFDETLLVLDELDRILNIHDDVNEQNVEETSVEECLRELDDYLQTFDCSEDSYLCPTELIIEQKNVLNNSEVRQRLNRLVARSASLGRTGKFGQKRKQNEWETLARNHRFRATISALKSELKPQGESNYTQLVKQESFDSDPNKNLLTEPQNLLLPTEDTNRISFCLLNDISCNPEKSSQEVECTKQKRNSPLLRNECLTNKKFLDTTACDPLLKKLISKNLECPEMPLSNVAISRGSSPVEDCLKISPSDSTTFLLEDKTFNLQTCLSRKSISTEDLSTPVEVLERSKLRATVSGVSTTNFLSSPTRGCVSGVFTARDRISAHVPEDDTVEESPQQIEELNCSRSNTLERVINIEEAGRLPDLIPISESGNRNKPQEEIGVLETFITRDGEELLVKDEVQGSSSRGGDVERPSSSSWLRSSMRRIRHFRLPSDPSLSETQIVTSQIPDVEPTSPVPQTQTNQRPYSAPVRMVSSEISINIVQNNNNSELRINSSVNSEDAVVTNRVNSHARSGSESSRSRRARSLSSSGSSLASSVDSTPSCSQNRSGIDGDINNINQRRQCDRPTPPQMPDSASPLGQWPHSLSSMLATLGCTLGLFNVCRFATLSVHFGANFILQFLLLSFIFGIPLFTLQLCLGQQLGSGVVDMWKISPLFQGVGVALLISQAMLGVYSVVGVSWMFIYFRDSFITKMDQYKWAQSYEYYREDSKPFNSTSRISETVPDYLSGIVHQRHNISTGSGFGAIKFQVAFNLAVVWMIVFVCLSKGLRSYAKVVYVFTLLPIFGTFVLCAKLLGMTPADSLHGVFPETNWSEFFLNTKSWLAASQETFLTWGLLGAAVMQLASHNKHKHLLQRDSSLVIILTITILMLTAFLANTCIEILHFYGYNYLPDSFEHLSTYIFLRAKKDPLPPSLATTPVRYMSHTSFVLGEKIWRPGMDRSKESGYQVLRFATELVPATLALLGPSQTSPFWAVLFYFILILFGIAQQLAIWHCVITGIMAIRAKVLKSWETTITFFSCTFGFILGLPMTTEMGIYVVYLLDMCAGGIWWIVLIYVLQILAVFMVRGRPYSGDTVVMALFSSTSSTCALTWLAPMLSFTWNVILPVALMAICITHFRTGNYRELFLWHHKLQLEYWSVWVRQIGSMIQLLPLLCIPVVALIQSYRYLNNGPNDILERIQLLYRPPLNSEHMDDTVAQQATSSNNNTAVSTVNIPVEDPPPKYTPPPSYTTATGARIAKLLRQSIRRSMRRITNSVLGETSRNPDPSRTILPPPDYSAVLVEMNNSSISNGRSSNHERNESRTSQELASFQGSTLTAADVASILRSSFRRSTVRNMRRTINRTDNPEVNEIPGGSISNENLVDGVAPLGRDPLFVTDVSLSNQQNDKPITDTSSVIGS